MQDLLETLERAEGAQSQGAQPAVAAGASQKREGAEEEVARLHEENVRLRRELEAARWQPGHSLAGVWKRSRAVCAAALAAFGVALSAGLALLCCPRRKSKRSGPAARHDGPVPSPNGSARPESSRAGPRGEDQANAGLEDGEDEDALEYDLSWFEARCPMIFGPIRACRGAVKTLSGPFKMLCCSCSRDSMMAAFIVFAFFAAGLAVLWHLGYLQPILKTLVVYVYLFFFFVVFIVLVLAELGRRFADKVDAGFEAVHFILDYTQELLHHFHLKDRLTDRLKGTVTPPSLLGMGERGPRGPPAPEPRGPGPQPAPRPP